MESLLILYALRNYINEYGKEMHVSRKLFLVTFHHCLSLVQLLYFHLQLSLQFSLVISRKTVLATILPSLSFLHGFGIHYIAAFVALV